MSTKTLGTSTTSGLTALAYLQGGLAAGDVATIAADIKDDLNNIHPIIPGSFSSNGILYVPNRGQLKILPGDWVGVDANGWPILVSKYSIATGGWSHS